MKIYLLIFLCLITQTIFASFSLYSKNDSTLIRLSNQSSISANNKTLSGNLLSNSFSQPAIFQKKKKSLKYKTTYFLKRLLNKVNAKHKNDFSFGGLMLGILLGPIGVAISYLTKNKKLRKWSIAGCVTDIGLGMLFIFIAILAVTF